ncbi:MAG: hypothetical protein EBZ48_09190, partial [Proteobacteria bacterium]|nr:hypothetical protein [Pseudomonadota bacterium]
SQNTSLNSNSGAPPNPVASAGVPAGRRDRSANPSSATSQIDAADAPKPSERTEAQQIADELRKYKTPERVGSLPAPTENSAPRGKDKIFGENPVVGPSSLFAEP